MRYGARRILLQHGLEVFGGLGVTTEFLLVQPKTKANIQEVWILVEQLLERGVRALRWPAEARATRGRIFRNRQCDPWGPHRNRSRRWRLAPCEVAERPEPLDGFRTRRR